MQVKDIPVVPTGSGAPEGLKELRQQAPEMLRILIEQIHAIEDIQTLDDLQPNDLKALAGGNMSVDYAIRVNRKWMVIKLRTSGAEAEAEALRAWKQAGANVVAVFNSGVLPQTEQTKKQVKFLVLEAAMNGQNQIGKTVKEYIKEHSEAAQPIAEKMGEVLAAMHTAVAGNHYGEFADMWGSEEGENAPHTWNAYLMGYVDEHARHLRELGFTQLKIDNLKRKLQSMKFPEKGVYLHGDFSERNSILTRLQPYQVIVFDPNPLIGDPSWDLAILQNNFEFAKRKLEHNRDDANQTQLQIEQAILEGVLEGYHKAGQGNIKEEALYASQLMQCLYLLPGKEKRAKKEGRSPEESLEALVIKDTLFDKLERLAY